jgi:hypothetical protein
MSRLSLSVLALALAVFGLFAQAPGGKKGGGAPKNLKLLPADGLGATMQSFTAALGVQCMHCHIAGDFASDENPKKEIARGMITMAREINAKFPDGKQHVRCFTCHRGEVTPKLEP